MSAARDRKEAARRLGIELHNRHVKLLLADGPDEVNAVAMELGQAFNDNIEYIVFVLKTFGGLEPAPPLRRSRKPV